MEPRITLVTLGVTDLAAATKFYRALGFPADALEGVTFLKLRGAWLSLFGLNDLAHDANVSEDKAGRFAGFSLAHNVRTTEEVDAIIRQAEQAGAAVTSPPRHRDWGGYLWEIAWNPQFWVE